MNEISLSEEFKASAQAYADDSGTSLTMLLTKFSLLMRHTVENPEEKTRIAMTMFDCGMGVLNKVLARPRDANFFVSDDTAQEVQAIFEKLLTPESANYIPQSAPKQLSDAALSFIRQAEAAKRDDFKSAAHLELRECNEYKAKMSRLGETALGLADKFRAALDSCANVKTANPVMMSKPLSLKPAKTAQS